MIKMRSFLYLRNTFRKISNFCTPKYGCAISPFRYYQTLILINTRRLNFYKGDRQAVCFLQNEYVINPLRTYSKKKKSKKAAVEEEESDTDEEDSFESQEEDVLEDNLNIISRSVPSMRIDTVAKAGLGVTKKKVEKEFYAKNLRLNGVPVLKKSFNVGEGDEVDIVKGPSPDNANFLLIDRVIVQSIGKITGAGSFPVKLQVFKGLTIENYADPWVKSSPNDPD